MFSRNWLVIFLIPLTFCGVSPQNDHKILPSSSKNQAVYTGLSLGLPLPAGYSWRVNTEAKSGKSGTCFPSPDCIDSYHQNHYALDFGRYIRYYNNTLPPRFEDNVVDVVAAASGTVVEATPYNSGCFQAPPPYFSGGKTCKVYIDHGGGYITHYLHFADNTIVVKVGDYVVKGQYLGKMGTTGPSSGTHLHFEVLYAGSSLTSNNGLLNITLDGRDFIDGYKFGDFVPSTNGFTFDYANGNNLHTCLNAPSGGNLANNWTFTCNRSATFSVGQTVWSNLLLINLQQDICARVEWYLGSVKKGESGEWCSNTIEVDGGWEKSYLWNSFAVTEPGNSWSARYFVRVKNHGASYLPAAMAVTPDFTVTNNAPAPPPPTPSIPAVPVLLSPISVPSFPPTKQVSPSPSIALNWATSAGVVSYSLLFYMWDGSRWNQYGPWDNLWNPATIAGVPPNTYCAWVIKACNSVGCSNWSAAGYFQATW